METLLLDLKYGLRMLLKKPGFTIIAAIALALGIGANTAIFSIVNAVLLNSLAFHEADRLVMIWHTYPKINLPQASVAAPAFVDYRDNAQSFESMTAFTGWSVNLTGAGEPERVLGNRVSAGFFPTLKAEAALGRTFLPEEDQPGRNQVVVLSDGFWKRRFAADPDIVGKTLTLDGNGYTVVGVMPADFESFRNLDLWTPIAFTPEQLSTNNHGHEYLSVIARLKPGVTMTQAQAEMDSIANRLVEQGFYPGNNGWGITVVSLREEFTGQLRPYLLVLLAAVGFVLLIACANVANLLLARATARQKEISIRSALGASRARVIRQLLTESVLLALVGGLLGLAVAYGGLRLLITGVPSSLTNTIPGWNKIGIDPQVLVFTLAVSLLTGIVFGLVPALQTSKPNLNETLKEGGRSSTGGMGRYARNSLVVFEVAITLMLLVGAGLLIKSFLRLQQVSPGFDPENVLTMRLSLPRSKYKEPPQIRNFYQQLLERVEGLPGVEAAGLVSNLPMSRNNWSSSFGIEGHQVAEGEMNPHGDPRVISPDYFRAMRIPLLKGRIFTDQDSADSKLVVIIDETLVKQYFPEGDPIGKRIAFGFEGTAQQPKWREIVGVMGQVKHYGPDGRMKGQIYLPYTQFPQPQMSLVVRTPSEPTSIAGAVRSAVLAVDSDQPVYYVMPMEQLVSDMVAPRRISALLLMIFAGVALTLAAVGIYGVMSYSVTQRSHEIGIRMALGANRSDVLALVVKQGMAMAGAGVAIGLGAAFAL
ncbi:MAG TPA: ABC transporter permease, partial [Blastocatellia bacterium]|nr:ABC transporter permease [Blastocatellia bacterium]